MALALLTAVMWGLLPLVLRVLLPVMDGYTITWIRFGSAGLVVGVALATRGELPDPRRLAGPLQALLGVAVLGLTINYTLFVLGVRLTSPAVAQTVTQLSSLFLLLGGLVLFRERFAPLQWAGFILLLAGLLLFFNRRLPQLLDGGGSFATGVRLLVLGSLAWAAYGLAQKRLLREYRSPQILWLLYVGGALVLTPLVHPGQLRLLDGTQRWALLYTCLNTLVGYGAYAEAMKLGEVTRVSALVTTAPLFSLLGGELAARWAPAFAVPDVPNLLTVLGACGVVGGSALCALGRARPRFKPIAASAPPS